MVASKKMSKSFFDCQYGFISCTATSLVLYAISFVAIFLIIDLQNVSSIPSKLHNIYLTTPETAGVLVSPHSEELSHSPIVDTSEHFELSLQGNGEEKGSEEDDYSLIPPENISTRERIAWFRRQLPELRIFQPTTLSQQFHSRVLNFTNKGCSILFYMIWLSPSQSFGKREFLTMDTLFKAHPQGCLLIISKSMDSKRGNRVLKPLLDRGFKALAITPDLPFLVKDTPAEAWLEEMKSGTRDPGKIPLFQNLSNLLRLALLYKYGGVYVDIDLIILKNFSGLRNAIGAQSVNPVTKKWNRLNGAVMVFDRKHPILLDFLQEFASTFDGNRWGHNGPYLVSRVIDRVGNTPGYNLTILPPRAFYLVVWNKIERLFKKPENEIEARWVESEIKGVNKGETYAVHLWNKISREFDIEEGSVMARLISEHCIVCDSIAKILDEEDFKSDSSGTSIGLRSIQKSLGKQGTHPKADDNELIEEEEEDPLIPPKHMSRDERIDWFRNQLPKLKIFKPVNSSQHFHYRVLNFLNRGCSTLFHIIWLSSAKSFGKREFVTLDSFFKVYPQQCLVILSRSMESRRGYTILKPFLDRGFKVIAITPDLPFLFKGTPAESWLEEMKSGDRDPGSIPLFQNLSNLLRLAFLYKYGGVYMDSDMIIMKDFTQFKNAVGAQSIDPVTRKWTRLNGAVMIFDIHHPILVEFMREFALSFDGNKWGHNGPYLVTRVIERVGNSPGYNLTILPHKAFFPVDWVKIRRLFKKPVDESDSKWVENTLIFSV
ncbi:lactosylceramide 4-alpha-galactosyltransferase-like [Senna tora]|uniref:Lactosylceramide 4-alpha-galactosyltransferase-like n=1 Tax=Senna tora TaxID=362788 RepID=A0A835CK78_9FABA|nr:lactosylceramide 4-alpha-galactosyltransferase-like [Senna tora]